jgi:hypothetical protein
MNACYLEFVDGAANIVHYARVPAGSAVNAPELGRL